MLSPELDRFCNEWTDKAAQYSNESIDGCYDKFFTLFVVFNRLYAEATFELARRNQITLTHNKTLPDRKGATDYCLKIIGVTRFQELFNSKLVKHVERLILLIEQEKFYIKLSIPNGERQREKDLELLSHLRSTNKKRLLALLDFVYSVRCNLFHGHKCFQPAQVELLRPTNVILAEINILLRQRLSEF